MDFHRFCGEQQNFEAYIKKKAQTKLVPNGLLINQRVFMYNCMYNIYIIVKRKKCYKAKVNTLPDKYGGYL